MTPKPKRSPKPPSRLLTEADIHAGGIKGAKRGFSHPPYADVRPEIVALVEAWIWDCCEITPRFATRWVVTSYGWKATCEKNLGVYITVGEFIVAALRAGARARQAGPQQPNAVFTLKLRKGAERRLTPPASILLLVARRSA